MRGILSRLASKRGDDKESSPDRSKISIDLGPNRQRGPEATAGRRDISGQKSKEPEVMDRTASLGSGAFRGWAALHNKFKSAIKRHEGIDENEPKTRPGFEPTSKSQPRYQQHAPVVAKADRGRRIPKLVTMTTGLFERLLLMRKSPLFHGVTDSDLQRLAALFKEEHYSTAHTVVHRQGDPAEHFYVIRNGAVSMTSNGIHLGVLKSPAYFGEMALLTSGQHYATVTTIMDDTQCLSLSKDDFNHFTQNASHVRARMEQALKHRTSVTLKSIPFFSPLQIRQKHGMVTDYDEEKLSLLAGMFRYIDAAEGQDVFQQGQGADSFYVILQGCVKLFSDGLIDSGPPVELIELHDGDWFGEDALVGEHPLCTSTATSITRSTLLRLDREDFVNFGETAPELQTAIQSNLSVKTADQLISLPFFAKIKENKPWSKLALLGSLFRFRQLATDDVVCREGEFSAGFYIIAHGMCRVHVFDPSSNSDIMVDELNTGQWFGEMSLLLDSPRTATVTCVVDTLLCVLNKDSFSAFNSIAPELSESFNSLVLHRTSNALKRFELFRYVKENKPWSKLELLATIMKYRPVKEEVMVIKEGTSFDALYLITNGVVDQITSEGEVVATIKAGGSFGESALVGHDTSPHSFVTKTNCLFLVVNKNQFDKLAKVVPECISHVKEVIASGDSINGIKGRVDQQKPKKGVHAKALGIAWGSASINDKIAILKAMPVFEDLGDSVLCYISTLMKVVMMAEHTVVWTQGDPADGVYIIIDGSLNFTVKAADGKEGPPLVINRGAICGCYCMTNKCSRLNTSTTQRASTLAFMSKEDFMKFLRVLPSFIHHELYVKSNETTVAEVIKVLPYFANLKVKEIGPRVLFDPERLQKLAALFQLEEYPERTIIYKMGEASKSIYHIVHGRVSISSTSLESNESEPGSRLHDNDWFGDIGQSCTSTVLTLEPTLLMKLPLSLYPSFSEIAPDFARRVDQTVNLRNLTWLSRLAFFSGLKENKPWSKISLLGSLFTFRECSAGEEVCHEGDNDRTFYIVVEGRLKVTVINEYDVIDLGELKQDDWFGEISLLLDTPRTATITCLEHSLLCSLTFEAFTRLKAIAPELTETFSSLILLRTVGTLKKFKLFDSLKENKPFSKKDLLASLLTYKSYEPDIDIFLEGDEGDALYLILNGTVQVTHKEMNLGRVGVGEYFGESALLLPIKPRNATVTTLTPCLFLTMSRDRFQKFLSVAPELLAPMQHRAEVRYEKRRSLVIERQQECREQSDEEDHQHMKTVQPTVKKLPTSIYRMKASSDQEQPDQASTSTKEMMMGQPIEEGTTTTTLEEPHDKDVMMIGRPIDEGTTTTLEEGHDEEMVMERPAEEESMSTAPLKGGVLSTGGQVQDHTEPNS